MLVALEVEDELLVELKYEVLLGPELLADVVLVSLEVGHLDPDADLVEDELPGG